MNWSKPCAKDNPNLTFQRWLQIHDDKEKRGLMLKMQSRNVTHLADVAKNFRNHLAVGDPYANFTVDKALNLELQRFQALMPEGLLARGGGWGACSSTGSSRAPTRGFDVPLLIPSAPEPAVASSRRGSSRGDGSRGGEPQPGAPPVPALQLSFGGASPGRAAAARDDQASGRSPLPKLAGASGALGRSSSTSLLGGGGGGARSSGAPPRPSGLLVGSHSAASLGRPGQRPASTDKASLPWPTANNPYLGCRRGTTMTLG